jgi:transposase
MSAPKKVKKKSISKANTQLPTLHPHAAGIDIGAAEIQVAVPCDADSKSVRTYSTFTDDLHAVRDWLLKCGVQTVAMESTSVYWIPLFQILEAAGLEVCLVNARHCKNLPGRKTDISDCQWLQYLHSVGLLRASFRPPPNKFARCVRSCAIAPRSPVTPAATSNIYKRPSPK